MTRDECVFYEAWQGECGNDSVPGTEPPLCEEHRTRECSNCGGQATTMCGHAGQFVCGRPLCETCECPSHNQTGHGSGRTFGVDPAHEDIVTDVTYTSGEPRGAHGLVNGVGVDIEKTRYNGVHWRVRSITEHGESSFETFDDEEEADEYFETLLNRYEMEET